MLLVVTGRRAGISGTNWTGKSVTIRRFVESHPDVPIESISLSELVESCPYPMVQEQTPDGSRWMVEQVEAQLNAAVQGKWQIFDRTPIDILAFTRYAFDRLGTEVDEHLLDQISGMLGAFDILFFVSPSEDWPVGVSPPLPSVEFARKMHEYLVKIIKDLRIEVVYLPWDLDSRQKILVKKFLS